MITRLSPLQASFRLMRTACCVFALCGALPGCLFYSPEAMVDRAKRLAEEGKTQEAYSAYVSHIEYRLDSEVRSNDENPFFYFILIGDLYLQEKSYDQAIVSYAIAYDRNVKVSLVADRIQLVAESYIAEKNFDNAWAILEKYRDLDPLSFDYRLSELHRTMVQFEQDQTD